MTKYFLRLILLIAAIVGIIALVGSLLPRDFSIERSIVIEKTPAEVFPLINCPQKWPIWSAQWSESVTRTLDVQYAGEAEGVGAMQTWSDPRGPGKLWISASEADKRVEYVVQFHGWPKMTCELTLSPEAENKTKVTWTSVGSLPGGPFYGFWSSLFSGHMGYECEKSLDGLKAALEESE